MNWFLFQEDQSCPAINHFQELVADSCSVMQRESILTAKPALSFSVLGKECRLARQSQILASVWLVLPPSFSFIWGPHGRESSVWKGGTMQCCEKAACADLPKSKPSVSLKPPRWIFYESIQFLWSFFTSGGYSLLPLSLWLSFLPCLRATRFFSIFPPILLQKVYLITQLQVIGD